MRTQRRHEIQRIEPLGQYSVKFQKRGRIVIGQHIFRHIETMLIVKDIEISDYILIFHFRTAERHGLVENSEGIAHRSVRLTRNYMQRFIVYTDSFLVRYLPQIEHDIRNPDTVEVIRLASGQNRRQHLMLLGCREYEYRVCRRLLQCLEEGIERRRRKHMDLIYDVHAIFSNLRRYLYLISQGTDIIHSVV